MMTKRQRFSRKLSTHQFAQDIAEESREIGKPIISEDAKGIFIPHGVDLTEIISELEAIDAIRKSVNESVKISVHLEVPPWEGAEALRQAIHKTLGAVRQLQDEAGRREQLRVQVSTTQTIQIPWGILDLPGLSGYVKMGSTLSRGISIFTANFSVIRKYEGRVAQIVSAMRNVASTQCLHRNQAFSIEFRDEAGELLEMPMPSFFELSEETPIFSRKITSSIERNIMVPLTYSTELAKRGITLKRGILFAGKYGVGKTLLASHIARMALESGWTFIYVKNSSELPDALRFAMRYQPVVLFGEDIDRVAGTSRTEKVNELLNQLDGIDGKRAKILTILTTNHPENINKAMRRPGRIDHILRVLPPDAEAVERMLRTFGGERLAKDIDLTEPALLLENQSAARIREILQRCTLEVLRRTQNMDAKIVTEDLVAMAQELIDEESDFATTES